MTFDDLPDDWSDRPLTDPALVADVLDLVVFARDRQQGAVSFLLCDEDARLVQPVTITDIPATAAVDDRRRCLRTVVGAMSGRGGLLVAVAREDGLSVCASDEAWRDAAVAECSDGVRLLGVHVVTHAGSREVPAA
jgi:hypothetical protein